MFKIYGKNRRLNATAHEIYGSIVAQTRKPVFYADWCVPDTVEGRFDVLVVHLSLVVRRLNAGKEEDATLGQRVAEAFIEDMDDTFREMGVGDLAVPKRMKAASEAYNGRLLAYSEALDGGNMTELMAALTRNMSVAPEGPAPDCERLAAYMEASASKMSTLGLDEISKGHDIFAAI